jgi:hypothetical protein
MEVMQHTLCPSGMLSQAVNWLRHIQQQTATVQLGTTHAQHKFMHDDDTPAAALAVWASMLP